MTVTLQQQGACVRREIGMREHVYPRWIAAGRMTQAKADAELEAMRVVHATLEALLAERVAKVTPELF